MANAIPEYDIFQSDDYGAGVFYATDSNSVDKRCRWWGDDGIYDCPNGYIVDTNGMPFIFIDGSDLFFSLFHEMKFHKPSILLQFVILL